MLDLLWHGAFARNCLRYETRTRHTLAGCRGACIVHKALVDQRNRWLVVLFDEDGVVQTVLGARPSIADGDDDRIHLLFQPFGVAGPFIWTPADVVGTALGKAADGDLVAVALAQLGFDRILDRRGRPFVVGGEADTLTMGSVSAQGLSTS